MRVSEMRVSERDFDPVRADVGTCRFALSFLGLWCATSTLLSLFSATVRAEGERVQRACTHTPLYSTHSNVL